MGTQFALMLPREMILSRYVLVRDTRVARTPISQITALLAPSLTVFRGGFATFFDGPVFAWNLVIDLIEMRTTVFLDSCLVYLVCPAFAAPGVLFKYPAALQ